MMLAFIEIFHQNQFINECIDPESHYFVRCRRTYIPPATRTGLEIDSTLLKCTADQIEIKSDKYCNHKVERVVTEWRVINEI